MASGRCKGPWYVDVVREGSRPSGCPRPKRRRGWLRRKHRSLTLWWQRRAAVRGFCFRRHTFLGGTSEEPRPWAIKRERSPGRFCPALLVVSSSEFTLSHGHWKCRSLAPATAPYGWKTSSSIHSSASLVGEPAAWPRPVWAPPPRA